jgi:hypothetical protein
MPSLEEQKLDRKPARTKIEDLPLEGLSQEELLQVAGGEHVCGSETGGGIDDCGYPICY